MLVLKELEVMWLRRSQEQSVRLFKIFEQSKAVWSKRSEERQAKILNQFENQLKTFNKQWATLFKNFDAEQKELRAKTDQLALKNRDLFVGLSLLYLCTRFLILQQNAALEERTERMKLEGNYNVRGALGMSVQFVSIELLLMFTFRTHSLPS